MATIEKEAGDSRFGIRIGLSAEADGCLAVTDKLRKAIKAALSQVAMNAFPITEIEGVLTSEIQDWAKHHVLGLPERGL